MFPLWDLVIAPVLEAAGAQRIVEIGALRGETTTLMLDRLGPEAELHVVDPVPEFDPTQHEQRFPGRYVFHRDVSHNVLPQLGAVDAALVDGDHNWFTVHGELTMLSRSARDAGMPLPVLVMHDVGWPYGRRDLYYVPERIPAEHRHPYDQRGMQMGRRDLLPPGRGGLSPTMNNAVREGGPGNGVMTALDDFMAEYDRPLRRVVLPIYFGLAIVVEEQRLAARPDLVAVLDRLESADGRHELLELAEQLRIKALTFQHGIFYGTQARVERGARRYLDLLKGALLDEHYLENEVRLAYAVACANAGRALDPMKLHDPRRELRPDFNRLQDARRAGTAAAEPTGSDALPFTAMGRARLDHLEHCLDTIRTEAVAGDLVECGTGHGGGGIFLRGYLDAYEVGGREVWVADPFRGPESDLNVVREGFDRFGLLDERVRFLQGELAASLPDAPIAKTALVRIGARGYEATRVALDAMYDRITLGGFVVVDDGGSTHSLEAIEKFRADSGIEEPLERVDWSCVAWRKLQPATPSGRPTSSSGSRVRTPLAPARPDTSTDLSVVVVFYNMRREAARSLHALSRAYQREVDDLDYEVIVVENGSADDQKLGAELVESFGPEFSYVDLGTAATPSPASALNAGIEVSRGRSIALMIDGAHILTPRVLRFGMLGLDVYKPAMVATQQWYVGPGQQPDALRNGYDEEYEDRLFEEIDWPADGYRLFDIGHFVGDRDWFDGLWESNCIFVPRDLLEQFGCLDEAFSMPGGGFANLDLYERIGAAPGVTVVSLLGEGSFHQAHGGTTTNESDSDERSTLLTSYRRHYTELRGRTFRGPGKPIHFVGSMFEAARRTRARRRTAPLYFKRGQRNGPDGRPEHPVPVPDELKLEFTDAFWRSFAWRETKWLGYSVPKCPSDLVVYQELIAGVRPDWIVETNTGGGGRTLFLASICDLVGHGQVVSIDVQAAPTLPDHPRITYLAGDMAKPETAEQVRAHVGDAGRALVLFGLASRPRLIRAFEEYAPLVPVGSYVVFEETVTNGNPVWPGMGPGPAEAIKDILARHSDFAPDPTMERLGLTFNPGGFLKRIR